MILNDVSNRNYVDKAKTGMKNGFTLWRLLLLWPSLVF